MRYIHSAETLDIPEGGTFTLFSNSQPSSGRVCEASSPWWEVEDWWMTEEMPANHDRERWDVN